MQFISDMEEAVDLCRLNIKPYSWEDAIKVAALACMYDRSLAEKDCRENFFLQKLILVGTTRKTFRANV